VEKSVGVRVPSLAFQQMTPAATSKITAFPKDAAM
jgi:hypothetical protein